MTANVAMCDCDHISANVTLIRPLAHKLRGPKVGVRISINLVAARFLEDSRTSKLGVKLFFELGPCGRCNEVRAGRSGPLADARRGSGEPARAASAAQERDGRDGEQALALQEEAHDAEHDQPVDHVVTVEFKPTRE